MTQADLFEKKKLSYYFITVLKVLFITVYGCGYHIERFAVKMARIIGKIISIGFVGTVCAVGEWVLLIGKKIGKSFAVLGTLIARSFVADFCWWAPIIGGAVIVAVLIVSNFFSVALEVRIDDTVVGYVKNEQQYHSVLNQVEDQIREQMVQTKVVKTDDETESIGDDSGEEQTKTLPTVTSDSEAPSKLPEKQTTTATEMSELHLENESYSLTTTATYSLSLIRNTELSGEEDLYADVYSAVSELVGTNYGLYVNGELKVAAADKQTIETVLAEIKAPYETGEKNTRVEFIEDVVVKKGMFSVDSIKTGDEIRAMFENNSDNPAYYTCKEGDYLSTIAKKFGMTRSQLQALNPDVKDTEIYEGRRINIAAPDIYLRVKTIKTEIYTTDIDFSVTRKNTSELYVGTTKVQTAGKKGEKRVTAEITYIDGVRQGKKIVDTEVLRKPTTKVILVGTKKKHSSSGGGYVPGNFEQGSGTPSGNFRNPLPGCYVSCGFGGYSGHTGADLCLRGGTLGAAVYAADGGTVEYSGRVGGYGNLVRINHGNGFTTYYAHLNTRYVQSGDKVSKGQTIGRAGSTGNSTGPHLHFEVRYHGSAYNPLRYISV